MGTGSPHATTRGLEDTPYFGSTRLPNLPDEAQLASATQIAAAAIPRAARTTESDRRIPIRPNTISPDACPQEGLLPVFARNGPPPFGSGDDIATRSRRKWGAHCQRANMVNQRLAFSPADLPTAACAAAFSPPRPGQTVAPNPHCFPIAGTRTGILLTVQGGTRFVACARGATEACDD